jgi:hypothetical protein
MATPLRTATNCGRYVGRVPAVTGTRLWRASDPARPSTKITGRNRPNNIASPSAVLYQVVLTEIPANAEPLLLPAEANA